MLLGVVGFWLAHRFIRSGRPLAAHALWVVAYTAFAAILGLGYNRFLFAGTWRDWRDGRVFALSDWFGALPLRRKKNQSQSIYIIYRFVSQHNHVFVALLCMGVLILPGHILPTARWLSASLPTRAEHSEVVRFVYRLALQLWLVVTLGYVLVVGLAGSEFQARMRHNESAAVGWLAPAVGFACAQLFVFSILYIPFALSRPARDRDATQQRKAHTKQSSAARSKSPIRKSPRKKSN